MLEARVRHGDEVHITGVRDDSVEIDGEMFHIDEVELLPPCDPSKVVAVGRNYAAHAQELGSDVPDFPLLFFKPPSSVIGCFDEIVYPSSTSLLHYEGEIALVIGEKCRDINESSALDYIKGVTCLNDVTARDWQGRESQWARAKGMDTFCPIGPYIQTEPGYPLDVETRLNGELVQSASTEDMHFSIPELVSEASRYMTLNPGDVIATGTPEGVGELDVGDVVGVEVSGVGALINDVVSDE